MKHSPLKRKSKSLSYYKKKAWKVFSLWIRLRDSKRGVCKCITCGIAKPINEMHAGHAIAGRYNYLLFDEELVFAQCPVCNIWRGGNYSIFATILIKKHGVEWFEEKQKYKDKQFTAQDYEKMIEKYSL